MLFPRFGGSRAKAIGNASKSSWRDFVDGAICPVTSPVLTPWLMRPIKSCSDLSPNVSLMSCVTSKRRQPPHVPLVRARSYNFILPHKENKNLYRGVCPPPPP